LDAIPAAAVDDYRISGDNSLKEWQLFLKRSHGILKF